MSVASLSLVLTNFPSLEVSSSDLPQRNRREEKDERRAYGSATENEKKSLVQTLSITGQVSTKLFTCYSAC